MDGYEYERREGNGQRGSREIDNGGSAYAPVRNRAFRRGIENIKNLSEARGSDGYNVTYNTNGEMATGTMTYPKDSGWRGVGSIKWDMSTGEVHDVSVDPAHRTAVVHLMAKSAKYADRAGVVGPIGSNRFGTHELDSILKKQGMDKPGADYSKPCEHCGK
jgi:hypothetical protein